MYQRHLLDDGRVEALGDAVVEILERVGILCQSEELLAALAAAGARVHNGRQTVTFPRAMTLEHVERLRAERPEAPLTDAPFARTGLPSLGCQVAQLVHDHRTGQRWQGRREDFIRLIKIGERLHGDQGVGHCLLSTDVAPLLEPIEAALLLAEHVSRPQPVFAWNARQVPYLREMGEILGKSEWYSLGAICIAHPFRFDRHVAERLVLRARIGESTGLTAMPVAGMTTPISLGGFVAVAAAEMVASWVAARAVNPTCALGGSMWAGTVDLRTGEVSYCAFDAMLYAFACCEFLRRWAHISIPVGGGEYCDARDPGYYAAWEKAYKAMTIAAFQGRHPSVGQGMLEEGKTLSVAQLLLERELAEGIDFFTTPLGVSAEELDLDTVFEIGHGLGGSHLDRELTLRRFREFSWSPGHLDRSGWRRSTDRAVLDRLQAHADALLAEWRPPERDEAQLQALRAVVDRARRELA